ncbi:outer membrane protein assembly factor BamB family protein [Actinoplanes sp. RD1]|uniref:outer membrane protein assembly factor BamB family protein n=1 Tax=Actinoplanes sp. RD1 TaxID=3064538 RepID=UPI002742587C|nr:PQQ-binding-like beta-propeller repeat protein [Actinoplanes sp. RD1]
MIRRVWAVAAVLVLGATVPATPAPAAGPSTWPQPGSDSGRSFYNPGENLLNSSTIGRLKPRWTAPAAPSDCPGRVGPVVAGGLTLTQDTSGLVARDSATGRTVWRDTRIFFDRLAYHLVVAGTTVVVTSSDSLCGIEGGDADGYVCAFDLATGRLLWRQSPNTDAAQLIVTRGMVIVSGNDYGTEPNVEAYRLADGTRVWADGDNTDGRRTLFSLVPVGNDVLITQGGVPRRVDAVTGRTTGSWSSAWTPLAAYGDWLFVGDSADWSLKAIRVSTGAVAWSADRVSGRVATDGRRLYLATGTSLAAYDVPSGRRVWRAGLGAEVGQPLRAGGLVYVSLAGRPVAVRNAATGAKVATVPQLSVVSAIAGGRLVGAGAKGLVVLGV